MSASSSSGAKAAVRGRAASRRGRGTRPRRGVHRAARRSASAARPTSRGSRRGCRAAMSSCAAGEQGHRRLQVVDELGDVVVAEEHPAAVRTAVAPTDRDVVAVDAQCPLARGARDREWRDAELDARRAPRECERSAASPGSSSSKKSATSSSRIESALRVRRSRVGMSVSSVPDSLPRSTSRRRGVPALPLHLGWTRSSRRTVGGSVGAPHTDREVGEHRLARPVGGGLALGSRRAPDPAAAAGWTRSAWAGRGSTRPGPTGRPTAAASCCRSPAGGAPGRTGSRRRCRRTGASGGSSPRAG